MVIAAPDSTARRDGSITKSFTPSGIMTARHEAP
jgi:hypothetical protein